MFFPSAFSLIGSCDCVTILFSILSVVVACINDPWMIQLLHLGLHWFCFLVRKSFPFFLSIFQYHCGLMDSFYTQRGIYSFPVIIIYWPVGVFVLLKWSCWSLSTLCFLAQDILGLPCIFLAPNLKSVIFLRSPGFCYWRMVFRNQDGGLDVCRKETFKKRCLSFW